MRKLYLPFALSLLILISWGKVTIAQHPAKANTSEMRMHRDVALLASDSLQGREAGTFGEQMAADYISKQMHQIGLLPGGDSAGSYLSAFRMNYPVLYKAATLRINKINFKYTEDFGATDLSAPGNVSAPLINIGKGIAASGRKNGALDVKGKIVVLDISNGFGKLDKAQILELVIGRVKAVVESGAVGVILHNSSRHTSEDVLFGSPFTASMAVPVVYMARLPYNKISRIKTASCTLSVEIDRTVLKPVNVIGRIDNKSKHTVVVGAHYDHVGITKPRKGDDRSLQVHNGADDNASGTAAMLELARWAVNNETLKYNYIFVAFSAEEKGLFGSKAFSSRSEVNNLNIDYMLNLDMVGRLGCQGDTINVLGVASSPAWEQLIDSLEHPAFSIRKINGAPPFSDHAPFLKKGIPVIYFTTGLHPDYHTPKDDTELLNYQGMDELVAYIRQFMRSAEALPAMPFKKINVFQQIRALIQTF